MAMAAKVALDALAVWRTDATAPAEKALIAAHDAFLALFPTSKAA
jgi:hypothetical protein